MLSNVRRNGLVFDMTALYRLPGGDFPLWIERDTQSGLLRCEIGDPNVRVLHSGYNGLVPETKPFRLTESVKAAG